METTIIKIGNSQGLIIPKRMLNRLGINKKVEISVKDGSLSIAPVHDNPRHGWENAFASATANQGFDKSEFESLENDFDSEEWTW